MNSKAELINVESLIKINVTAVSDLLKDALKMIKVDEKQAAFKVDQAIDKVWIPIKEILVPITTLVNKPVDFKKKSKKDKKKNKTNNDRDVDNNNKPISRPGWKNAWVAGKTELKASSRKTKTQVIQAVLQNNRSRSASPKRSSYSNNNNNNDTMTTNTTHSPWSLLQRQSLNLDPNSNMNNSNNNNSSRELLKPTQSNSPKNIKRRSSSSEAQESQSVNNLLALVRSEEFTPHRLRSATDGTRNTSPAMSIVSTQSVKVGNIKRPSRKPPPKPPAITKVTTATTTLSTSSANSGPSTTMTQSLVNYKRDPIVHPVPKNEVKSSMSLRKLILNASSPQHSTPQRQNEDNVMKNPSRSSVANRFSLSLTSDSIISENENSNINNNSIRTSPKSPANSSTAGGSTSGSIGRGSPEIFDPSTGKEMKAEDLIAVQLGEPTGVTTSTNVVEVREESALEFIEESTPETTTEFVTKSELNRKDSIIIQEVRHRSGHGGHKHHKKDHGHGKGQGHGKHGKNHSHAHSHSHHKHKHHEEDDDDDDEGLADAFEMP